MTRNGMEFLGWGTTGEPQDEIEVEGYREEEYWRGGVFLGPDADGIVPVYRMESGEIFPTGARLTPAADVDVLSMDDEEVTR